MPMAQIDEVGLAYEIIGEGRRSAVITPGGRYSKDIEGVRELADQLARRDFRVLIWDRPNCGASDVCFAGASESRQNADMLAGLLRALDMAPALLIAGSGGAREALLTVIHHADVVERAFVFWISGGSIGLSVLPFSYCHDSACAAASDGMAAVAELPAWKEQIARNPANRDRLLGLDARWFVDKMHAWGWCFFPEAGSPLPCISPSELRGISRPVMILRSSPMDMHHTRATSETVHALIPGAQLAEPPWGEREWPERLAGFARGESAARNWPRLVPQIVEFAGA